jgi:threonylcarbamoyladenosine tRNA methylthiotransferase MtaB
MMKRRYRKELYAERVAQIRNVMPHCCIGVDVITGFPGETEEHFLETYNFLNDLDISYLHVFTYSERDNTEAVNIEGAIDYGLRKKRSKMLRVLSAKKRRSFYESQLGEEKEVLFEANFKDGYITGFTENYVKVKALWNPELVNTKKRVILKEIDEDGTVLFEEKMNEPQFA